MIIDLGIYPRALELAARLDLSTAYDMQYVAAAESQGATLMTLDQALYQHARTLGIAARLLP